VLSPDSCVGFSFDPVFGVDFGVLVVELVVVVVVVVLPVAALPGADRNSMALKPPPTADPRITSATRYLLGRLTCSLHS
jgi:hypothetical protein